MKTIIAANTCGGLQAALVQAKAMQNAKDTVCIELATGIHNIKETIVIDGTDFENGLILRAAKDAYPVLDGAIALDAVQFVQEGDCFVYHFQPNEEGKFPVFHDFYDNGKKIPICKSKQFRLRDQIVDRKNRENPANLVGLYVDEDSLKWLEEDVFTHPVEFNIFLEWEHHMFHAVGVDRADCVTRNGKNHVRLKFKENEFLDFVKVHHPALSIENRIVYYGNHPALLTPGTWCYDSACGTLYYMPESGRVEAPAYSMLACMIEVKNANNISFENLTFTGTGCIQPALDGYMSGQANTEYRYEVLPCSAVLLRNSQNISIENCIFKELGSNGIQSAEGTKHLYIRNCQFENIAMCGITLGEHTCAWKAEKLKNHDFEIINNYLEHIGTEFLTCPAIFISHIDGLKLNHNTIRDVSYSGISVGWGWSTVTFGYEENFNIRNAEIAYNRIENFMKLLRDGGAIYVLGGNCKVEYKTLFNHMHDNFAVRPQDAEWKNCSRGYYLDGSSSNWHVYRNVTSGAIRPLFIQYVATGEFCHNILAEQIYSTDRINPKNLAPERNVITKELYQLPNLKKMFEEYPVTKEIFEAAGSSLDKKNYRAEDFVEMNLVPFQDYAKEETERVKKELPKRGEGDVRFAFITDFHYKYIKEMQTTVSNLVHAINELNAVEKIDFICLGGDNVGNYPASRQEHIDMMAELAMFLKNCDVPVLCVQGNHDDNSIHGKIEGTEFCRTGFEVPNEIQYGILFSQSQSYKQYHSGGEKALYGYYDIPEADTRIVLLNTSDVPRILGNLTEDGEFIASADGSGEVLKYNQQWNFGYSKEQLLWLCNEALANAPKNVIFIQHVPFDYDRHPGEGGADTINADAVDAIIKAFENGDKLHKIGTVEDFEYEICVDFGGEKHNVPARIGGHCHSDTVSVDKEGFLSVTTMLAGRKASGMHAGDDGVIHERVSYSATETSMDIFTFSSSTGKLTSTRYGSGVSREIR